MTKSPTRLLWAALAMDTAFFSALATVPFFVKRPDQLFLADDALGALLATSGLAYVLAALCLPRLLRTCEPASVARLSGVLAGACFVLCSLFVEPILVFVSLAVGRGALGAFWPNLMAMVGQGEDLSLAARIARFNCWWGSGKAVAFLVCGLLLEVTLDPALALRCSALAMMASVLLVGGSRARGRAIDVRSAPESSRADRTRDPAFETALLVLLAGATVGAIWESQFPKGLGQDRYAAVFGDRLEIGVNGLLFCLYGGQASLFFVTRAWTSWARARWLLPAAVVMLVLAQGLAVFTTAWWWAAAGLFASGISLGCFYSRSLYVAQAGRTDTARRSGVHEAALSFGAVLGPPLGGWLAVTSGSLMAPMICAFFIALCAFFVVAYKIGSKSASIGR